MTNKPNLGPFSIGERLGEGGMGAVYLGCHRDTGVDVALKVIHRRVGAEAMALFHREVQSHAQLLHPGIVYLYEYGTADADPTRGADPAEAIPVGSPYVAMELAADGVLRDHQPLDNWGRTRAVVEQLLDALAFAHARGVVHRDLKPENILVFDAEADEPTVKLADFGLAHAFDDESEVSTDTLSIPAGTPLYMAPEQAHGRWRNYGPWTDIYALGCVVWELVCGRPPFDGASAHDIIEKHESEERPPLAPRFPVPGDLERWIHRAMAVEPTNRFRRAAVAARSLASLGDVRKPAGPAPADDVETVANTMEAPPGLATTAREQVAATLILSESPDGEPAPPTAGPANRTRATDMTADDIPDDWGEQTSVDRSLQPLGTGLGLFGLRESPFVDRSDERKHLWTALRRVAQSGEPRVAVIVGGSGAGKSRLVDWMTTRSHELGVAEVMRANHTPGGIGPTEGIPGMVRRLVRGYQLSRREFYDHVRETLPVLPKGEVDRQTEAKALTELAYPTDNDADFVDGPRYRFSAPAQKCALVCRLIRRYRGQRVPIVWLDDAQWGDFALALAAHLLDGTLEPLPALCTVTIRADSLADDPSLNRRIEQLTQHDCCTRLDLGPLERGDHRQFLDEMLPLEEGLADELVERTEGNPLFATQLLQYLVERDELRIGSDGFAVRDDTSLELPDDVHDLWMRRLARLIAHLGEEASTQNWSALELAAAGGREVDDGEWRAVCRRADIDDVDRLRDELLERALAERSDGGWSFTHGMLVESIERHARQSQRWRQHHRRWAEALTARYPNAPKQTASRRADHLESAGDDSAAIDALELEITRLREVGDAARRQDVIRHRERLLDAIDAPDDAPRRLGNAILAARCELANGESPDAVAESLDRVRQRVIETGDDALLAKAWIVSAWCQRWRGEFGEARDCAAEAAACAERAGAHDKRAEALVEWAWSEYSIGNLDAAEQRFAEAHHRALAADDLYGEMVAQRGRAVVALGQSRRGRAATQFRELLERTRETGFRWLQVQAVNGLGELAKFGGAADEARTRYLQYRRLSRELNRPDFLALSYLNVAQVELLDRRFDLAALQLSEAERRLEEIAQSGDVRHFLNLARLTIAAGTSEWTRFDELFDAYQSGWPDGARLEKDIPWMLEMAGDYAAERNATDRAHAVWELAANLWLRLDADTAAARVEQKTLSHR